MYTNRVNENNHVILNGKITKEFKYSHKCYGEGFYQSELAIERLSGTIDCIPIIASDRLVKVDEEWTDKIMAISGEFRSYNKYTESGNKLILNVFTKSMDIPGETKASNNQIILDGYICKKPVYRETPMGRKIVDFLLAVNRSYDKSDYIPCICWGRNAIWTAKVDIGTHVKIEGRIQSRKYKKKISEEEIETRIAYEVSASKIEEVTDEKRIH